jgi:hypothetical protein
MVFTPLPIFWISLSFGARSITSAVTGFSTCHSTSVSGSTRAKAASSLSGHNSTPSAFTFCASAGEPSKWKTILKGEK